MKKAKIWISACFCIISFATFVACSSGIGNPITDDVQKVSLVRQNIPKDYKIPIRYIPKELCGKCWIELNVYHLEESLEGLSKMFGNISSNKDNISIFIKLLQDVRYRMGGDLEWTMQEFKCHYREERWETKRYFDFVEEFFIAARSGNQNCDCDPPPCPMTEALPTASPASQSRSAGPCSTAAEAHDCISAKDTTAHTEEQSYLPDAVEKGLLSLLLIPLAVAVFLLVWKVHGRRRGESRDGKAENGELFTTEEGNEPPLDGQTAHEKDRLNTVEVV